MAAATHFVTNRSVSLAVSLGLLGGTALVLANMFFLSGKYLLLPYAVFVVAIAIVLKSTKVQTYAQRFGVGFGAFMLATFALYLFVIFVDVPRAGGHPTMTWALEHAWRLGLLGHIWRLSFLAAVGAVLSAATARVSE
jgi:hypothetical protein